MGSFDRVPLVNQHVSVRDDGRGRLGALQLGSGGGGVVQVSPTGGGGQGVGRDDGVAAVAGPRPQHTGPGADAQDSPPIGHGLLLAECPVD